MKKLALFVGVLSCVSILGAAEPADIIKTKCASCHGQKMEKQALGKSKIANTLDAATIEKDLKAYKAKTLNKTGLGATMWGQVANFTDEEIKALAEYIPTLK